MDTTANYRLRAVEKMPSIVVSHPIGNPFSYNCALSFQETGQLLRFQTSLYGPFGSKRRQLRGLPRNCVKTYPGCESLRLIAQKTPVISRLVDQARLVDWVHVQFDRNTSQQVGRGETAVYCYEDAALQTFRRARESGVMRIYELPIMYYREMRRLFKVQVEREPQLAPFFRTLHEPEWKLERKDSELREADLIVVPADFVKASVQRHLNLKTPIVVNPYGADINVAAKEWGPEDLRGPIRLLFIGKLSPRKGLHILFEALAGLPAHQFHLTLVGLSEQPYLDWLSNRYRVDYEWHGGMGRDAVYGECRKAHALVLPSLAEGFGLVLLEAMASGIPIIGTDQTAARDLVDDDVEGWTVPSGSAECLRECLVRMLGLRDTLPDMGAAARRKAESFSWANYRERVRTLILPAITRGS